MEEGKLSNIEEFKTMPKWAKNDDSDELDENWTQINSFIIANLASGRTVDQICAAIIHPATGEAPTPEMLRFSFPTAFVDDVANMKVAASLYDMAIGGGRESIKAATTWLSARDNDRWKDPAKRIEITGKDGNPIETKQVVNEAMAKVSGILEELAAKKKLKTIDAVEVEDLAIDASVPDLELPDVTYTKDN